MREERREEGEPKKDREKELKVEVLSFQPAA